MWARGHHEYVSRETCATTCALYIYNFGDEAEKRFAYIWDDHEKLTVEKEVQRGASKDNKFSRALKIILFIGERKTDYN